MSHDVIKLDYGQADAMSKEFKRAAEQTQAVIQQMQGVASKLEAGALRGEGGSAFVEAIGSNLINSLKKLATTFTDLDKDVQGAIKDMQEADARSRDKIKG